jgi:hypothetical protein
MDELPLAKATEHKTRQIGCLTRSDISDMSGRHPETKMTISGQYTVLKYSEPEQVGLQKNRRDWIVAEMPISDGEDEVGRSQMDMLCLQ